MSGIRPFALVLALTLVPLPARAGDENTVADRLQARVIDLDLEQVPLAEALQKIADAIESPILIEPELVRNRTEEELRITLNLRAVTARTALDCILYVMRLGAVIEEDLIVIKDRENLTGDQTTVEYDLAGIPRFSEEEEFCANAPRLGLFEDPLYLEGLIAPGTWDPPNAVLMRGGRLVVRHGQEVHEEVRRLLDMLRTIASRQIVLEISLFHLGEVERDEIRRSGMYADADLAQRLEGRLLARWAGTTPSGVAIEWTDRSTRPRIEARSAGIPLEIEWTPERSRLRVLPVATDSRGVELAIHLDRASEQATRIEQGVGLPVLRRQAFDVRGSIPRGKCLVAEAGGSTVLVVEATLREVRGLLPLGTPAMPAGRPERVLERLRRARVEANFDRTPLAEIIDIVRRQAEVDVVIDRSIEEHSATEADLEITMRAGELSAWRALELTCDYLNVEIDFLHEVVILRMLDRGPVRRPSLLAHDLGHLVLRETDHTIDFDLGHRRRWDPFRIECDHCYFLSSSGEPGFFEELVRSTIAPHSWDGEDRTLVSALGHLFVRASGETQDRIAAELSAWNVPRRAIGIDATRFVAGPDGLSPVRAGVVPAAGVAEIRDRLSMATEVERFRLAGVERGRVGFGRSDQVHYLVTAEPVASSEWYRIGLGGNLRIGPVGDGSIELEFEGEAARLLSAPDDPSPRVVCAPISSRAVLAEGEALLVPTVGVADPDARTEYLLLEWRRLE